MNKNWKKEIENLLRLSGKQVPERKWTNFSSSILRVWDPASSQFYTYESANFEKTQ